MQISAIHLSNTVKLLRFPFSLFLLPISLFSLFLTTGTKVYETALILFIWHVLVFPASNGYNSWNDQDRGPIGALLRPPKPSLTLLFAVNLMDIAAIALSCIISIPFAVSIATYILFSRAYSYRAIRLKKYPLTSFIIVSFFQGAWVLLSNVTALDGIESLAANTTLYAAATASFFVATIYPLTQIYQHQADRIDGVRTISMVFGVKGTFILSGLMFMLATIFMFLTLDADFLSREFLLFNAFMAPVAAFFIYWAIQCFKNERRANFTYTMVMLMLSALANNSFFLTLLIL